jgi:hypothetical protein
MSVGTVQRHVALGCALVAALPAIARADVALVVEEYTANRPQENSALLAPVRRELAKRGVLVEPNEIITALGDGIPLPARTDPSVTIASITAKIESAQNSAAHAKFDDAIRDYEAALRLAHENPSTVVADGAAPMWLTRAYVGLAFAHHRLGHESAAADALADQIRSFPDRPVTSVDYGPESEKLYGLTRKQQETSKRGTLLVVVSRPEAQIYVNEVRHGPGSRFAGDLLPGRYRLLVQVGNVARRYAVDVDPAKSVQVERRIDWELDSNFEATKEWVGMHWRTGVVRTADVARQLSSRVRQRGVAFVTIELRHNRRFVVGNVYEPRASGPRTCTIEIDGAYSEHVATFASCILGEKPEPPTETLTKKPTSPTEAPTKKPAPLPDPEPEPTIARSRNSAAVAPKVVVGVGGVLVAIGGVLFATNVERPDTLDRRPLGLIVGYAGLATIGAGVYKWARGDRESWRVVVAGAGGAAAIAIGAELLFLNSKEGCVAPSQVECKFTWSSAPLGWTLVGTGVASAGLAAYLHVHDRRRAVNISLQRARNGALAVVEGRW